MMKESTDNICLAKGCLNLSIQRIGGYCKIYGILKDDVPCKPEERLLSSEMEAKKVNAILDERFVEKFGRL